MDRPHQSFRLFDVLHAKQELAVEVAQIDGIQVHDDNFSKAGENQVLEELTADATSADHKHPRLDFEP